MPRPNLSKFLATRARAGGRPCMTCSAFRKSKRKQLEALCADFAAARRSGRTTHSWPSFFANYLTKATGYPFCFSALKRHLERCVGQELT